MNLVIDIGNTRIKTAIFDGSIIIDSLIDKEKGKNLPGFLEKNKVKIDNCIIASVAGLPKNLKKILKHLDREPVELSSTTPVPFKNNYSTKETLGKDRIAGIAGACALYPSRNVLVIDAGTAITFDLKTAREEYLGGNISPGLKMRFKALHEHTAHLPLLEYSDEFDFLGENTERAIRNGVQNGLIFEMNSYLETIRNKYDKLVVLLTGGDAHFFDNKLKKPIFVVSNLTLIGLNYIIEYNAERI